MTNAARGRIAPSPPPPYPGSVDTTQYAYEWNEPREAIQIDRSPTVDLDELAREKEFLQSVEDTLKPFPRFLRTRMTAAISDKHSKKGRHIARLALDDLTRRTLPALRIVNSRYAVSTEAAAETMLPNWFSHARWMSLEYSRQHDLVRRFNQLPDATPEDAELLAQDIANYISAVLTDVEIDLKGQPDDKAIKVIYAEASALTRLFKLTPPLASKRRATTDELTGAVLRMLNPRFWQRHLQRYAVRWREHLHIAYGDARRSVSPYCSKWRADEWSSRRRRSREIMSKLQLEDEESGERFSLIEQIDKSISNPALRRVELMTRIGGFEKIAMEQGYEGTFFTLTAPSKYHAFTAFGHRNSKWNGVSPRDTQRYLNKTWQKIRAELARNGIRVFGVRVTEPHHDGTPHWHGLIFSLPEETEEIIQVMQDYATKEDAHELTTPHGIQPRFDAKKIDPAKGSATGYIVKYVSKNIDGFALEKESDDETGRPLVETARHATAWASCWGIRQFQFLGGAPVTVWRELRRFRDQAQADKVNPLFSELHRAADTGDWREYVMLQGGPFAARDMLPLRTWYQDKKDPNSYGEYDPVIKGLKMPFVNIPPVETRTRSYRIVRMKPELSSVTVEGVALDVDCSSFDLTGATAPARTRVNNCTGSKKHTDLPPGDPPEMTAPAAADDPEQLQIGRLTHEQRQALFSEAKNQRTQPGSAAEHFENLARHFAEGDSGNDDRADAYMRAAQKIREMEQPPSDKTRQLADQIMKWVKVRSVLITPTQAIELAKGKEVTAFDTVYRANLNTGEIIPAGINKPWRQAVAKNKADSLITRWKSAAKPQQ